MRNKGDTTKRKDTGNRKKRHTGRRKNVKKNSNHIYILVETKGKRNKERKGGAMKWRDTGNGKRTEDGMSRYLGY